MESVNSSTILTEPLQHRVHIQPDVWDITWKSFKENFLPFLQRPPHSYGFLSETKENNPRKITIHRIKNKKTRLKKRLLLLQPKCSPIKFQCNLFWPAKLADFGVEQTLLAEEKKESLEELQALVKVWKIHLWQNTSEVQIIIYCRKLLRAACSQSEEFKWKWTNN